MATLTGKRKPIADALKIKDWYGLIHAIRRMEEDGRADLEKYYDGQKELHDIMKRFLINKIVTNSLNRETGLVCKLGFSDDTYKTMYVKVLVMTNDVDSLRETTWSLNSIEIDDIGSIDYMAYKYLISE